MPAENLTGSYRLLSVAVEWVALKLHILEVPNLNIETQTNPTEVSGGFLQSFQANSRIMFHITSNHFLSHPIQLIKHPIVRR
jgi:hypothetical protein